VVQVRHQAQVLLAGEEVVHRRELAGHADRGAYRIRFLDWIVARDPHLATVGADQRRKDLNRRGLAGAVGAEQREDRPLWNVQVDAVEDNLVAIRLAQPDCRDRRVDEVVMVNSLLQSAHRVGCRNSDRQLIWASSRAWDDARSCSWPCSTACSACSSISSTSAAAPRPASSPRYSFSAISCASSSAKLAAALATW
jgi:hypothetical protein